MKFLFADFVSNDLIEVVVMTTNNNNNYYTYNDYDLMEVLLILVVWQCC